MQKHFYRDEKKEPCLKGGINGYESVYYKIKDEYQQAFKDAIEQLNS